MAKKSFFDDQTPESLVKAEIVSDYFFAWARVLKKFGDLAYVDLYAGRGQYKSGDPSTPILVIQKALSDPDLHPKLRVYLNDSNKEIREDLRSAVFSIPDVDKLVHQPEILDRVINLELTRQIEARTNRPPTLTFIDPYGYKGLSLRLIEAVVRDFGCECIFFFNYNRINPAVTNELVGDLINDLFGEDTANQIRLRVVGLTPQQREEFIMDELQTRLKKDHKLVTVFRFLTPKGGRTSHYLIFVTKDKTGHKIMKQVMAKHSSEDLQGVASFEFNRQPKLVAFSTPIDDLAKDLLTEFAGQTLSMRQIFEKHHVGRPFIEANYKEALSKLEQDGQIKTTPPVSKRRKGTFGDGVQVTFLT